MRIGFALLGLFVLSETALADVYVRGHTRSDGTYVQPHYRTNPDDSRLNNYSTRGNTNPHTGERGTVNPDRYPSYGSGSSDPLRLPSYGSPGPRMR